MSYNLPINLTYDDVQLKPLYSDVMSRSETSLETNLSRNFKLKLPFVASPMDTVCGYEMAATMMKLGGVGILHRFMSVEDQSRDVDTLKRMTRLDEYNEIWGDTEIPIAASVGVGYNELERASSLIDAGANVILIDVAHGHHRNVKDMISSLMILMNTKEVDFDIIAGNIATSEGARDLCKWGVDGIRCGIGGGCFTPEMEVKTSNGLKRIKDIEIGDEVYSHTGELKPVINKFEYDDHDEIIDIDGIEATPDHKFYVVHQSKAGLVEIDEDIHRYAEWIKAKDLTDEYYLIEL